MGKTFAMSGIMDWLRAASIRKTNARMIRKNMKDSIQEKIEVLKKTIKETQKGSEE